MSSLIESLDAETALSAAMLHSGIECSVEEIRKAISIRNNYVQVPIPKRGGGTRNLLVPPLELKFVQDAARKWLQKIWPSFSVLHDGPEYRLYGFGYSDAFRPIEGTHYSIQESGSYVDHARYHKDSDWFFQFDLKDAFYSVKIPQLQKVITLGLRRLDLEFRIPIERYQGYQVEGQRLTDSSVIEKVVELVMFLLSFNEVLPQGAPSSPFLFFLYLMEDPIIGFPVLKTRVPRGVWPCIIEMIPPDWKISGYIDNICISGKKKLPEDIKRMVLDMFERAGFLAHKIKEEHIRHGSPTICGLRISDCEGHRKIVLAKSRVRQIRAMIWQWQNNKDPLQARRIMGMLSSLAPIYGWFPNFPQQIKKPIERIGIENILRAASE